MQKFFSFYIGLAFVAFNFVTVIAQVAQQELVDSYYGLIGSADKAIAESDWTAAEEYLLTALANEPQNPTKVMVMSNLGIVQYNLGRDSLAIETLSRAHAIAPRSVTILFNRGQVFEAMGQFDKAYNDYTRVLELDSTMTDNLFAHAILSLNLDKTAEAEKDCKYLQNVAPDNELTHRAWATYYSVTKQWAEALPHYTALLAEKPSADDYCGRAVCFLMLNRLNEASADITSGLELEPDNRNLYFYRAHLNKARYRNDDARADIKRALGKE